MRVHSRRGIANGVVLVLVILVVAIPVSTYYVYFSKPITTPPSDTETGSTGASTSASDTTTPIDISGFETGGVTCGFGLTYGAPGGEGCFVTVFNNGTTTATTTGTCSLSYAGTSYPGTYAYTGPLIPQQSEQRITCGEYEGIPAGAGNLVTGYINLTTGQNITFSGKAVS